MEKLEINGNLAKPHCHCKYQAKQAKSCTNEKEYNFFETSVNLIRIYHIYQRKNTYNMHLMHFR